MYSVEFNVRLLYIIIYFDMRLIEFDMLFYDTSWHEINRVSYVMIQFDLRLSYYHMSKYEIRLSYRNRNDDWNTNTQGIMC